MSELMRGRENSGLAGHRAYRGRPGRRRTCLTCWLASAALCWIASVAIADSPASPANSKDASLFKGIVDVLAAVADNATVPASGDAKPADAKTGSSESLITEAEKSENYQKIVAESAYPPSDSPEKLTLEQLEAIAKLAPQANKAGMQVHPAMVPLFKSMTLHYTGGSYKNAPIRFRLHTPEPYQPGKKYPMVVWLHGSGECGSDNVNQLSHLHHILPYLVGPKKRDFFLLVPQCPHDHVQWEAPEICSTHILFGGRVECHRTNDPIALGDAPVSFTLAMVDAVMKQFPVDPNRVTIAGLSTGGDGTWRILERCPNRFAAAAPIVSWTAIHDKVLRGNPILKKIPIWAIYSSDDHGIDFARKEFERLRESGCHVFKTEFGVCGHRAWTPAMLQGDVFGWLISRAKDGDRFYAAGPSPTDPEKIGIFADVTDGDLKRVPTRAVPKQKPVDPSNKQSELAPVIPPSTKQADSLEAYERMIWAYANAMREYERTVREYQGIIRGDASLAPTPPRQLPGRQPVRPAIQKPSCEHDAGPAALSVEQLRIELVVRYITIGENQKGLALADKVKDRSLLFHVLLNDGTAQYRRDVLDYVNRELDQMEQSGEGTEATQPMIVPEIPPRISAVIGKPLQPIPAGKKNPKDECGKEWAMSPTTLYGLFPNGWDQETSHVPGYIINETGKQLHDRLEKAFIEKDLPAMKEFCDSFIRLDDIPLSSPWFDTSGGRLQDSIKYTLNEKAKPVVELLREIAKVQAESKKELVELAQKSLDRIDAILHPKTEK